MEKHLKPRTIKEWLKLIPFDRTRKEALDNCSNDIAEYKVNSLLKALQGGFEWSKTDQGFEYWEALSYSIRNMVKSIKLK